MRKVGELQRLLLFGNFEGYHLVSFITILKLILLNRYLWEHNLELEAAMKRMTAGKFYTHEQVEEMSKSWLYRK